jgi:hypothetical protein
VGAAALARAGSTWRIRTAVLSTGGPPAAGSGEGWEAWAGDAAGAVREAIAPLTPEGA